VHGLLLLLWALGGQEVAHNHKKRELKTTLYLQRYWCAFPGTFPTKYAWPRHLPRGNEHAYIMHRLLSHGRLLQCVFCCVVCYYQATTAPHVLSRMAFTTGQALRVTVKAVLHLMLCSCIIAFLPKPCRVHNELLHSFRAKLHVV